MLGICIFHYWFVYAFQKFMQGLGTDPPDEANLATYLLARLASSDFPLKVVTPPPTHAPRRTMTTRLGCGFQPLSGLARVCTKNSRREQLAKLSTPQIMRCIIFCFCDKVHNFFCFFKMKSGRLKTLSVQNGKTIS